MTSLVTCETVAELRGEPGLFPALMSAQGTHTFDDDRQQRVALQRPALCS